MCITKDKLITMLNIALNNRKRLNFKNPRDEVEFNEILENTEYFYNLLITCYKQLKDKKFSYYDLRYLVVRCKNFVQRNVHMLDLYFNKVKKLGFMFDNLRRTCKELHTIESSCISVYRSSVKFRQLC